jgi:hypothetical protein
VQVGNMKIRTLIFAVVIVGSGCGSSGPINSESQAKPVVELPATAATEEPVGEKLPTNGDRVAPVKQIDVDEVARMLPQLSLPSATAGPTLTFATDSFMAEMTSIPYGDSSQVCVVHVVKTSEGPPSEVGRACADPRLVGGLLTLADELQDGRRMSFMLFGSSIESEPIAKDCRSSSRNDAGSLVLLACGIETVETTVQIKLDGSDYTFQM